MTARRPGLEPLSSFPPATVRRVGTTLAGLVAGLVLACGNDGPTAPGPGETLELETRVHVLSSELGQVDATFDDDRVRETVARTNEIWRQAGIRWKLESIVREPARSEGEEALRQALSGQRPLTADVLAALLPRDRMLSGGWNVYLVRNLPGSPGIYLGAVPAAVTSEADPSGEGDPGRIFAHELGHSLTLQHVACTGAGNLMAPGCPADDRTRLTEEQIEQARSQAATGAPAGGG